MKMEEIKCIHKHYNEQTKQWYCTEKDRTNIEICKICKDKLYYKSKADLMFEKIGYKRKWENNNFVQYIKKHSIKLTETSKPIKVNVKKILSIDEDGISYDLVILDNKKIQILDKNINYTELEAILEKIKEKQWNKKEAENR